MRQYELFHQKTQLKSNPSDNRWTIKSKGLQDVCAWRPAPPISMLSYVLLARLMSLRSLLYSCSLTEISFNIEIRGTGGWGISRILRLYCPSTVSPWWPSPTQYAQRLGKQAYHVPQNNTLGYQAVPHKNESYALQDPLSSMKRRR